MKQIVFSRCPVGSITEYLMRTGELQEVVANAGGSFKFLQQLPVVYQEAHFTQTYPLDIREGGNIPPIWAQSRGDTTALIGVTFLPELEGLLVASDSSYRSLTDLAGKRIGIPIRPGMPIDFQKYVAIRGISQHLQEEGLAISDVTIVPVACRERTVEQSESLNIAKREFEGCTEEFKAVLEGICEAAFANSVKALRLEESGDFRNVVEPNKQIAINSRNNNSPLLITASHRVIDEHPEIVAAYMDLSIQKSVFLQDNPEAYYNVVSSGVYEATPKELKTVYNEDAHKLRCPALGVKELTAVEDQVRFLYDSGAIENIVDVSKWINVVFLT